MPAGHPPGFKLTPAQVCESILRFEKTLRIGETVRRAPLAAFLGTSQVTMNKWLAAWGVPIPPWPRGFVDSQGRAVLICIFDASYPMAVHWISPNCEALLGRPQEFYIESTARRLRAQVDTLWQRQPEMLEARTAARAAPGATFMASTALSTADGLEVPVEWTFRYGEHQTPVQVRDGIPPTGTYFCSIVRTAEARAPLAHLQQPFMDQIDARSSRRLSEYARNRALRSVTFGRDTPDGPDYVEVKGTLAWEDLARRARVLDGRQRVLDAVSVAKDGT